MLREEKGRMTVLTPLINPVEPFSIVEYRLDGQSLIAG